MSATSANLRLRAWQRVFEKTGLQIGRSKLSPLVSFLDCMFLETRLLFQEHYSRLCLGSLFFLRIAAKTAWETAGDNSGFIPPAQQLMFRSREAIVWVCSKTFPSLLPLQLLLLPHEGAYWQGQVPGSGLKLRAALLVRLSWPESLRCIKMRSWMGREKLFSLRSSTGFVTLDF